MSSSRIPSEGAGDSCAINPLSPGITGSVTSFYQSPRPASSTMDVREGTAVVQPQGAEARPAVDPSPCKEDRAELAPTRSGKDCFCPRPLVYALVVALLIACAAGGAIAWIAKQGGTPSPEAPGRTTAVSEAKKPGRGDDPTAASSSRPDAQAEDSRPTVRLQRVGQHVLPVVYQPSSGVVFPVVRPEHIGSPADLAVAADPMENSKLFGGDPPMYDRPGVLLPKSHELIVFATARNSRAMFMQTFNAEGRFWHKSGWEQLGIDVLGGPSVTRLGPGVLQVFARGMDSSIWYSTHNRGWQGVWNVVEDSSVTSEPSAVIAWGTTVVFARSETGTLLMATWEEDKWLWQDLGGRLKADSPPGVAASPDGKWVITAIRGVDDHLWQLRIREGVVQGEWMRVPTLGGITSSPAIDTSDWPSVKVVVRGADLTTYWADTSLDRGQLYPGKWRSWNQGFESSPAAARVEGSHLPESALVGINQRGEVAVLHSSPHIDTVGGPEWVSLAGLPVDDRPEAQPPDPAQAETASGTGSHNTTEELPEERCVPCTACSYYDHSCWASCELTCAEEEACALTGDAVQHSAARQSCRMLWGACGSPVINPAARQGRASKFLSPANDVDGTHRGSNSSGSVEGTSADEQQLDPGDRLLCSARLQDFCQDSIWRIDMYQVMDSEYEESCGQLTYEGSQRCDPEYSYSLFWALAPNTCRRAVDMLFGELAVQAEAAKHLPLSPPPPGGLGEAKASGGDASGGGSSSGGGHQLSWKTVPGA